MMTTSKITAENIRYESKDASIIGQQSKHLLEQITGTI